MYKFLSVSCLVLLLGACNEAPPANSPSAASGTIIRRAPVSSGVHTWQQHGVNSWWHPRADAATLQLTLLFKAGSAYGRAAGVAKQSAAMLVAEPSFKSKFAQHGGKLSYKIERNFVYLQLNSPVEPSALANNINNLAELISNPPLAANMQAQCEPAARPDPIAGFYSANFARKLGEHDCQQLLRLQVRHFIKRYYQRANLQILLNGLATRSQAQALSAALSGKLPSGQTVATPPLVLATATAASSAPRWLGAVLVSPNITELGALFYMAKALARTLPNFYFEQQGQYSLFALAAKTHTPAQLLPLALANAREPRRSADFWQLALEIGASNNWHGDMLNQFFAGFDYDSIEFARLWQRHLPAWRELGPQHE